MDKRLRDESKTIGEKHYADFEPTGAPPITPQGAINPGFVAPAERAPDMSEAICTKGPCRHFWHLVTTAGEGNPEGTWDALGIAPLRQHSYTCLRNPGMETDFGDDVAFACNLWEPMTFEELAQRETRQTLYQIRVASEEPVEPIDSVVDDDMHELEADERELEVDSKGVARWWFMLGREYEESTPGALEEEFERHWAEVQTKGEG